MESVNIKTHLIYCAVILGLIFLFYLAFALQPPKIEKEIIVEHRTDTIVKYDTVYKEKPVPKYIKSEPDTVYLPSIDTTAVLNKETKIYEDSTFQAQISGIEAELDWIKTFPKTTYVTEYKELKTVKKQRINWGFQAGVGYGVFTKKPDLYIGLGVQYNF